MRIGLHGLGCGWQNVSQITYSLHDQINSDDADFLHSKLQACLSFYFSHSVVVFMKQI